MDSYDYLGLGTVVRRTHPLPGVDLTFIGSGTGDAGDQYVGLDRVGRVVLQKWVKSGTSLDEFSYTYDRDGNRLTRGNAVNTAFNETYGYDSLNQLTSFTRGGTTRTQAFDYDALGNRDGVTTNGTTQTYTANKQNEITSVSGATTPTYDANGNMTTDETGRQFVYDAWNRLVIVKNSGGTTLKTYTRDGLGRSVAETASGTTTDFYFSRQWQVLEEAVSGSTTKRYVWSPVYVDAMILRDRATTTPGTLDERLWVIQDANFNVTALVNTSGIVVERYAYDPYGIATVMNASWTVIGSSAYSWDYLRQGGRLDRVAGLYSFRNRDYSATLGRWVTMDPVGYQAGDGLNLYLALANNTISYTDPSGLWNIKRTKANPRASAIAEKGDTIQSLADKIGLSAKDASKWLTILAKSGMVSSNGSEVRLADLDVKAPLDCPQDFEIPNVMVLLWMGAWEGVGKAIVRWDRDIQYLEDRGFQVSLFELPAKATQDHADGYKKLVLEKLKKFSSEKSLHGLESWSHGAQAGLQSDNRRVTISFSEFGDSMNYKLGLVLINACDGGWSVSDKGWEGGKGEIGGRDLSSQVKGSIFGGQKSTLVPVRDGYRPKDYIKPGEQDTNK